MRRTYKKGDRVMIRADARAMGADPDDPGGGPISAHAGKMGVIESVLDSRREWYDYDVILDGESTPSSFKEYELIVLTKK